MIDFKLSENLIKQVKRVVKVNGECHLCGCGNFYSEKETAIRKRDFTNHEQEEARFMLSFYKVDDVPNTTKELEDAFYLSRKKEMKANADALITNNKNIIDMSDDDEEDVKTVKKDEERKSKLIDLGCDFDEKTNTFIKEEFSITLDEVEKLSANKFKTLVSNLS